MLLAAAAVSCEAPPGPEVTVTVEMAVGAERPEYLIVSWLGQDGAFFEDQRVPQAGTLPKTGPLATFNVRLDVTKPGDRRLVVKALVGTRTVLVGALRISLAGGLSATVQLVPKLADRDADGFPDLVDDCEGPGYLCVAPSPAPVEPVEPDPIPQGPITPTDPPVSPVPPAPPVGGGMTPPPAPGAPDAGAPVPDAGATPPTPPMPDPAPPEPAAPTGLVAVWSMDDGAGTIVRDGSSNALHGQLVGAAASEWTAGHTAGSLRLRPEAFVQVPSAPAINAIEDQISISAWIRLEAEAAEVQTILGRQEGTGFDNTFWFGVRGSALRFAVGGPSVESAAGSVAVGRWIHVAATYDSQAMRVYVDGRAAGERALADAIAPSSRQVTLGADVNGSNPDRGDRFWRGQLDEVRLYEVALSPADIATLAR